MIIFNKKLREKLPHSYVNNSIAQTYSNRFNFDPSDRSELSSIHGTSSFIYKSLHVRQFEMSSYPSRYSGISLHSQREIFSSLHPDSIRFTLPENRNKKKESFEISKIRFFDDSSKANLYLLGQFWPWG